MKISITQVPQADELSRVIDTVEAVFNDHTSDQQIADYVGFTDRQGRYYRLASIILGLLDNHDNSATLTDLGKELIVLDETNRLKKIRSILKQNELFGLIIGFIENAEEGVNRQELITFLKDIIDGSESTILRRLSTIISWLTGSALIRQDVAETDDGDKETRYKINEELDESDFLENSFNDSIYPANYSSNEELDIKESHMQVISLLRKKEQGKIIVPEFQRHQVWKQQQKSRFIESLILNIPVPAFYISQDQEGNMIVVDGLQRSSAIFDFLANQYPLVGLEALPDLNNISYSGLDKDLRARIEDRELLLYILKPTVPMSIVYDIFNRINSNGSPLTSQEIRNCIYIGKSTRLLTKLAETPVFQTAIDKGIPYLRMKDQEAILRFFAFTLFDDYKGNLDDFLGKTMRAINRYTDPDIASLEKRFNRVMQMTYDFFGEGNFRIPTSTSRGRINTALFEVICVFFDRKNDAFLNANKKNIVKNYSGILLKDQEFIESIKFSTGSLKNVKTRYAKTFEILSQNTSI